MNNLPIDPSVDGGRPWPESFSVGPGPFAHHVRAARTLQAASDKAVL